MQTSTRLNKKEIEKYSEIGCELGHNFSDCDGCDGVGVWFEITSKKATLTFTHYTGYEVTDGIEGPAGINIIDLTSSDLDDLKEDARSFILDKLKRYYTPTKRK